MNRIRLIPVLAMFLLLFTTCDKLPGSVEAEIMQDCTGTYLRIADDNYHVCNRNKTDKFKNGDKVAVSFKTTATCSRPAPACYKALPPVAANVEVLFIRKHN